MLGLAAERGPGLRRVRPPRGRRRAVAADRPRLLRCRGKTSGDHGDELVDQVAVNDRPDAVYLPAERRLDEPRVVPLSERPQRSGDLGADHALFDELKVTAGVKDDVVRRHPQPVQLVAERDQVVRPRHRCEYLSCRRAGQRKTMIAAAGEVHDDPGVAVRLVVGSARVTEKREHFQLDARHRLLGTCAVERHDGEVEALGREGRHDRAYLVGERQRQIARQGPPDNR